MIYKSHSIPYSPYSQTPDKQGLDQSFKAEAYGINGTSTSSVIKEADDVMAENKLSE